MSPKIFRALILGVVVLGALAHFAWRSTSTTALVPGPEAGSATAEQRFSPADNIEQADIERLNAAEHSIDIAMFAFTDRYIAEALVRLADRGVAIRVYRDHQQFEDEQRRGKERDRESSTELFSGHSNIQVRVKKNHELMHLKAFLVDGKLLRDGSANWSPTGLKRQDNNAHYTTDPAQIEAFRRTFEAMWDRVDNDRVQ